MTIFIYLIKKKKLNTSKTAKNVLQFSSHLWLIQSRGKQSKLFICISMQCMQVFLQLSPELQQQMIISPICCFSLVASRWKLQRLKWKLESAKTNIWVNAKTPGFKTEFKITGTERRGSREKVKVTESPQLYTGRKWNLNQTQTENQHFRRNSMGGFQAW